MHHNEDVEFMKNLVKILVITCTFFAGLSTQVQAKEEMLDKVAAIVNAGVVLESEVQGLLIMHYVHR